MIFCNTKRDFNKVDLFFDGCRNIARVDLSNENFIEKLTKRHKSQFWMPHDFSYVQDATDYKLMSNNKREFFLKNLKFQTLLDSAATRGVLETLLPVASHPLLESWLQTHGFFESIHSESYAEIIKALGIDASDVFDDIMVNEHILNRGADIVEVFNEMHRNAAEWSIYPVVSDDKRIVLIKTLFMLNILENILFKTSFVCSFAFAENGIMEGSSKCIQLICRD
jgi:ribonucleoside-diphosphate reductase beta chain